jgi:hypothetical protein
MNKTCDRCGPAVRTAYRVHERGELYLCRQKDAQALLKTPRTDIF